ncbi:MAG: diguanylate cyclase [Chlamydiota bacterium]|nr:diguanylate cyclase [Chlamydiota bacterium]
MTMTSDKQNYSILVVDDDPVLRTNLGILLGDRGYAVTCVEDGEAALEYIQKDFCSILITDWMMPKLNGFELTKKIRAMNLPGYVFIIILTGHGKEDEMIKGLESGADEYLVKPISPAELMVRISSGIRILQLEESLKKSNQEIQYLAITDPLTKSFNRTYLNTTLPGEIKTAERYQYPLSLIMCDIDYFKKVNDTYGHQSGDRVLIDFVEFLNRKIRKDVDWIVRYGGEEFLIVLPHTDKESCYTVAQRIQVELSDLLIKINNEKTIAMTSSFGIVAYNPKTNNQSMNMDTLLKHADQALYQAKNSGRNTICVFDDKL